MQGKKTKLDSGGIRTNVSQETGDLNQGFTPLGHVTRHGDLGNSNQFPLHHAEVFS